MGKPIDLTGQKLHKLTINRRYTVKKGDSYTAFYDCTCECGDDTQIKSDLLLKNKAKTCGKSSCKTELSMRKHEGRKFKHLTVNKFTNTDGKSRYYFDCTCECGTVCNKALDSLTNNDTLSCGCKTNEYYRQNHPGVGKPAVNRLPGNLGAKQSLYQRYKACAKNRELSFNLTFDDFVSITSKPCDYCGKEASTQHPAKLYKGTDDGSRFYFYNGIDRVDSSVGYEPLNVVPCCSDCNYAKQETSVKDFLSHMERIHNYQLTKKR